MLDFSQNSLTGDYLVCLLKRIVSLAESFVLKPHKFYDCLHRWSHMVCLIGAITTQPIG